MNKIKNMLGWKGLALALTASAGVLVAPAPPARGSGLFMPSVAQQKQLGDQAAAQIQQQYHMVGGAPLARVDRVGRRLVAALPASDRNTWNYRFHVIDSKEVNAFALPGGNVYIFTGLLNRIHSDSELAAVMGHEMTHVRR